MLKNFDTKTLPILPPYYFLIDDILEIAHYRSALVQLSAKKRKIIALMRIPIIT